METFEDICEICFSLLLVVRKSGYKTIIVLVPYYYLPNKVISLNQHLDLFWIGFVLAETTQRHTYNKVTHTVNVGQFTEPTVPRDNRTVL